MFIQGDYDNLMKERQELMRKQCADNDRNRGVKSFVMYVLEVRFHKERVNSEISQRTWFILSSCPQLRIYTLVSGLSGATFVQRLYRVYIDSIWS